MKKIPELHLKAIAAVKDFQKAESSLLKIIQAVDTAKVFLEMGYSSLFLYLTEALKLSEGQAYAYSNVSRKAREVPELQAAVENGLSLYKAQRIVPVITKQNQEEWISKAKELSKVKLEMAVAAVSPTPAKRESVRSVGENRISVKVEISEKLNEKLKRVKTLISNRKKTNASLEDTLKDLIDFYLEKKDPLKKEKRGTGGTVNVELRPSKVIRRYLPTAIKRQVFQRDNGRCSFKGINGKSCASEQHLEIHHLKPWSIGGSHELNNLQTLCHAHHQFRH